MYDDSEAINQLKHLTDELKGNQLQINDTQNLLGRNLEILENNLDLLGKNLKVPKEQISEKTIESDISIEDTESDQSFEEYGESEDYQTDENSSFEENLQRKLST